MGYIDGEKSKIVIKVLSAGLIFVGAVKFESKKDKGRNDVNDLEDSQNNGSKKRGIFKR